MPRSWDADSLLDAARGYAVACAIGAGVNLDVFTILSESPATADAVAARIDASPRGMAVLLDALAALDLLTKQGGRYDLPDETRRLLTLDSPDSVLPGARHLAMLLPRWAALPDVVRSGKPYTHREGYTPPPGGLEAFIEAMHVFSDPGARELVERIDLGDARKLLDVGGGPGTYTIAFLRANPTMSAVLFDRPDVVEIARRHVVAEGLADCVELVAGDFYADELPAGVDVAWVSAIIHQNSRPENRELFAKVARALNGGGRIIIRDHVMNPDHTAPASGALFAINMLVNTAGGGTFSFSEIAEDLAAAGFENATLLNENAEMSGLVLATKPA